MPSPISHLPSPAAQPPTLARRLGTTAHLSPLLLKAKRLGLHTPEDLERLAIHRGLRYYDPHGDSATSPARQSESPAAPNRDRFTDEELALALLSPAAPYSMQRLRMGAAMISAEGNRPETIARLARCERSESIVRYVASCGRQAEPDNPFWNELLARLPVSPAHPVDRLPHLSRFVAMTGLTRSGKGPRMKWIRPDADRNR